ncbi:MAG: hypothetical protein IIV11_01140, partial [Clostridia bacterium]|nr:hypothetical protein [Clostridia bacterium]
KKMNEGVALKKRTSDLIFIVTLLAIITATGAAVLLCPTKSFSERENRSLQKLPSLSWRSVLSRDFSRLLGDFYSDQLPFREELGTIYSISELSLGKRECNGVFVGEGGVLVDLAKKQSQDREILNVNLSSAKALQGRNGAVCFWVPRSSDAFGERLPDALRELSSKDVESVDCQLTERMISEISRCKTPEEHYYRTDHHWTTKGAYTAYLLLSKELGYVPYDESFFRVETVATDFLGTSFSKSALPESATEPDRILLYRYNGDGDVSVTDRSSEAKVRGLYDLSALNGYDKYRVFLGGNYPHLSVSLPTRSDEGREKLLLLKDSFANSLIPFLALHFDIEAVDPRYATVAEMKALCESERFDKTLVLCSLDTILNERSVGRFLDVIG